MGNIDAKKVSWLRVVVCTYLITAPLAFAQNSSIDTSSGEAVPSIVLPASVGNPDTKNNEIMHYVAGKEWDKLFALTQDLITRDTNDATAFYWHGIASFQMHEPIPAVQSLRSAQKLGLENAAIHEALGLAYYNLNQFVLFEEQMKLAMRDNPNDSAPSYYLGLYRLSVQQDITGALHYLGEATRLNPSDWKSLYQRGYCLELNGNISEARMSYLESIRLIEANKQSFGWPYQGMARLDTNTALKEAIEYAQKAVEIEPNEPSHHFILAKLFAQSGDIPSALKEAELAVSQDSNDAAIRYFLFRLYRKSGNTADADKELKEFQTLNEVYGPE